MSWVILPVVLSFVLFSDSAGTTIKVIYLLMATIIGANVVVYYTDWRWGQRLSPSIGATTYLAALIYFVYLGYYDGASSMWIFIMPLAAFFILGISLGLVISLLGIAASLTIMLGGFGLYEYSPDYSLRFSLVYLLITAFALGYEYWRIALELQKEKLDQELEHTRSALAGMASVCAWCNSIRQPDGHWESLEAYVSHKEDKPITHSICPSCAEDQAGNKS